MRFGIQIVSETAPLAAPSVVKAKRGARKRAAAMPEFIAPQLCKSLSRPPSGSDWVHEIKFDGYRMQLRVENGKAVMRTRKGLDWTTKFARVAKSGEGLRDCILDGEVVALDHTGAPDFAALQAALSEGRSGDLIYFVFDLLFEAGEDLRPLPLTERKDRLKALLAAKGAHKKQIRFVDHLMADPATRSSNLRASSNSRAWFRSASVPPISRGARIIG